MTEQFRRKWGLVVSAQPGASEVEGIDLSEMRIVFTVRQEDAEAPNTMHARVYNLSRTTAQRIQKEFQHVVLQAGYEGGVGVIFEGNIKQVRRGRENATDTFVDIFAGDGDKAYNFAVVNKTLSSGATVRQQTDAIHAAMVPYGIRDNVQIPNELGTGGTLPRGKVLFGMAREKLGDVSETAGVSWSIQNGVLTLIDLTGYLPDEAVVLNSRTGMLGVPEATNAGIEVTTLLNPRYKIGTRVQIDNASINQTTVREQGFPRYGDLSFPANVADDGFYRVLVVEHDGDNWGDKWYSRLTCLAVDPSSSPATSVLPAG